MSPAALLLKMLFSAVKVPSSRMIPQAALSRISLSVMVSLPWPSMPTPTFASR